LPLSSLACQDQRSRRYMTSSAFLRRRPCLSLSSRVRVPPLAFCFRSFRLELKDYEEPLSPCSFCLTQYARVSRSFPDSIVHPVFLALPDLLFSWVETSRLSRPSRKMCSRKNTIRRTSMSPNVVTVIKV
jgi:hypothetical protein